jgi:hypothetical protein
MSFDILYKLQLYVQIKSSKLLDGNSMYKIKNL